MFIEKELIVQNEIVNCAKDSSKSLSYKSLSYLYDIHI